MTNFTILYFFKILFVCSVHRERDTLWCYIPPVNTLTVIQPLVACLCRCFVRTCTSTRLLWCHSVHVGFDRFKSKLEKYWQNMTLYRDCTDSRENVLHVCQLGDAVLQLSAMEREKVRLFLSQPEGWGSCVKSQQLWWLHAVLLQSQMHKNPLSVRHSILHMPKHTEIWLLIF